MSSASLQKLFCEVCSALKCSFEEFVREKVVFPSYSSAIFPSPFPPHTFRMAIVGLAEVFAGMQCSSFPIGVDPKSNPEELREVFVS